MVSVQQLMVGIEPTTLCHLFTKKNKKNSMPLHICIHTHTHTYVEREKRRPAEDGSEGGDVEGIGVLIGRLLGVDDVNGCFF